MSATGDGRDRLFSTPSFAPPPEHPAAGGPLPEPVE
jgi:hypothetical protein